MQNRDFKGVWIPKEIWLNTELSMLEKVLITEIDSLDNENHCTAGNDYFAEFCNCSKSAITKAIKHLKELDYIEEIEFNGRTRKLKITNLPSKIYYAESENLRTNNIYNNIDNNKKEFISKDINSLQNFEFGKKSEPKQNLYSKCTALLEDFIINNNCNKDVRSALINYLQFRISVKDKPLYVNMWKGMLKKLEELQNDSYSFKDIIQYSTERGYLSFYQPGKFTAKERLSEPTNGTGCQQNTAEEEAERAEFIENMKAQGKRVEF